MSSIKKIFQKIGGIKYFIVLIAGILLRLLPFKAPNLEPVMAGVMPFAKKNGYLSGFIFGFISMALFDFVDGDVGPWTWITATIYGGIGAGAYYFLKNKSPRPLNFFTYSIIGTLIFDALTGLTTGPLFFGQPFLVALTGQIPFTLIHLLGNGVLALTLSPLLYHWLIKNPNLAFKKISLPTKTSETPLN